MWCLWPHHRRTCRCPRCRCPDDRHLHCPCASACSLHHTKPAPIDGEVTRRKALPGSGSLIERNHLLHDKGQTVFDRKVTRVQPMHLRLGEVLEIGLAAFRREEDVALTPEDNGLRLMLPQEQI